MYWARLLAFITGKVNQELMLRNYEQTGYLVKGCLRLTICGESFDVRPGDSWSIPMDVEHGAQTLEDSIAIEVFSPVRPDYLPQAASTK